MTIRKIELLRGSWGLALLVRPEAVAERVLHLDMDARSLLVTRILGARQLAQSLLSGLPPPPAVLALGVWVDAVHAASAVGLAALDHRRIRAGVADALVAGAWAALGYRDLRRGRFEPVHAERRDAAARLVLTRLPGTTRLRAPADPR